jgi:carboxypeptidase family protein/TonB-dependent receptor-like protein
MYRKSILVPVALAVLFVFAVLPSAAQETTSDVGGHVSDPKGLAVAGAKVTVSNTNTGLLRAVETTETGDFSINKIPPGTYKITVEKTGFSTAVYDRVELNVGDKRNFDVPLAMGATSQTVMVTEEVPLIPTTSSEIQGNVTPIEVSNLPVVDRNFAGLMTLVPGVRPAENFDPTKTRSGNVTVNGTDGRGIDYNVDGGDNKDNVIGGIVQNYTMEGIQEFNVVTDRYSADSGRAVGAVVNVISKSGTNQYHGTAFGLFQNSGLNAKPFTAGSGPNPKFHRYQYGGSVGGPIKRDKLFFFGAFEQKREPGNIPVATEAFDNLTLLTQQPAPFSSWAHPVAQVPFPYIDDLVTVKVDWRITDKQTAYARYGREKWTNPNDQLGNPVVADLSQTNGDINQFHSMVLSHNYVLSPNKINTFSFQFQDFVNAIKAAPGSTFTYPIAGGGVATNPNICFGVNPGCGGGAPEVELGTNVNVPQQTLIRKYQIRDDFNLVLGRHNMKFGANYIYLAKLGGFFFSGANGYELTLFDTPANILAHPAIYPQGLSTPGTVEELTFNGGSGSTAQPPAHEIGLYYQDDFKVKKNLTLNLGLRWDAMPNFFVPQLTNNPETTNRTIAVLQQVLAAGITDPAAADGLARAQLLAGNNSKLEKTGPGLNEFQPRLGFAWDPTGSGKLVIRGGYGIARDQIFQNLTLWSIQQSQATIYQTIIDDRADNPGTSCTKGALCSYVLGSPLPAPAPGITTLAQGARGRVSDPNLTDAWSQQSSIGFAYQIAPDYAISVDYYHVLGTREPRMIQDNPQISPLCDPKFPTANPADPRCVNGPTTRLLDAAFVDAGLELPASNAACLTTPPDPLCTPRIQEIRTASATNRSHYDAINIHLQKRFSHNFTFQVSDVISWSNAYGGQATASYGGSNLDVLRQNQFLSSEYGPTQFDERNRFEASGVFQLPHGFQIAPIFEWSTPRPYSALAGGDLNGDGQAVLDRACVGLGPAVKGCPMVSPNSFRGKALIQMDLRASKAFNFGERMKLQLIGEMFNLFNRDNSCNNVDTTFYDASGNRSSTFGQRVGYCGGQGPGATFGNAYRTQLGFRFEF